MPNSEVSPVVESTVIDGYAVDEERALSARATTHPGFSIAEVAKVRPQDVAAVVESWISAITTIRRAALSRTKGIDWTINRDSSGQAVATLRKSGALKVREFFGISVFPRTDEVQVRRTEDGKTVAEIYGDAVCAFTGNRQPGLRGFRTSSEKFVGRGDLEDLKECARTALDTKAVRVLAGMSAVDPAELAQAWQTTEEKAIECCYKGHGFGTSEERRTGGQSSSGSISDAQAKRLWAVARDRGQTLDPPVTAEVIVAQVLEDIAVQKTHQIPRSRYDEAVRLAESWTAK